MSRISAALVLLHYQLTSLKVIKKDWKSIEASSVYISFPLSRKYFNLSRGNGID